MPLLDGFRPFNFNEGVPYVSVTVNGMTFNKSVVMKLAYPTHVVLLIDEVSKRIAIKKCDETDQKRMTLLQLSEHSLSHASRASSLREGAFW